MTKRFFLFKMGARAEGDQILSPCAGNDHSPGFAETAQEAGLLR